MLNEMTFETWVDVSCVGGTFPEFLQCKGDEVLAGDAMFSLFRDEQLFVTCTSWPLRFKLGYLRHRWDVWSHDSSVRCWGSRTLQRLKYDRWQIIVADSLKNQDIPWILILAQYFPHILHQEFLKSRSLSGKNWRLKWRHDNWFHSANDGNSWSHLLLGLGDYSVDTFESISIWM